MPVLELRDLRRSAAEACVRRFGAELVHVDEGETIPGTFWGEPEAGLAGRKVYARPDTPVHSLLHELGHYVCMTEARRESLWRNAGGDADEECAVCYLQVLLADVLPGVGRRRLLRDMDAWGYSFREGSAEAWWRGDARHARAWLLGHGLIDAADRVTFGLRRHEKGVRALFLTPTPGTAPSLAPGRGRESASEKGP